MRGLIYRWLIALRRPFTIALELMFFVVVLLMYTMVDETSEQVFLDLDSGMPLFLFSFCSTGIMMLQLANDRTNGLEKYLISTPISRRRYLLTAYLFYGVAGFLISLIYVGTFIISVYSKGGSVDFANIVKGYFTIFCALFLFIALLLLASLCMSITGGIVFSACIWCCCSVFSIIANSDPDKNPMVYILNWLYELYTDTNSALLICGLIVLSAAVSALIAFISIKLYKRRDIK